MAATTTNTMSSYKVTFKGRREGDIEVRRFIMEQKEEAVPSLASLKQKLVSLFPDLEGKEVLVSWMDDDGDRVSIKADEDLKLAIDEMAGSSVYKIQVEVDVKREMERRREERKQNMEKRVHPWVTCDGCEGPVIGSRFKCLACPDYDLCSGCQEKKLHSHHEMMRIESPDDILPEFGQLCRLGKMRQARQLVGRQLGGCMMGGFRRPSTCRPCPPGKPQDWCMRPRKEEPKKPAENTAKQTEAKKTENKQQANSNNTRDNLLDVIGSIVSDAFIPFVVDMSEEDQAVAAENKKETEAAAATATTGSTTKTTNTTTTSTNSVASPEAKESKDCFEKEKPTSSTINPEEANKSTVNASIELVNVAAAAKTDEAVVAVAEGSDEEGWTLYPILPQQETSAPTPTTAAAVVTDAAAATETAKPLQLDPKIKVAVEAMKNMGFTDEGGWLTNLLAAKGGDIGKVLDLIRPTN